MRILALLTAALSISACYAIDIVSPAKNAQPSVIISLSVDHGATGQYRFDVIYSRGTDAEGAARPMVDSLLLVNDDVVVPNVRGVLRNLEYNYFGTIPSGEAETLFVRLPIAVGVPVPATIALAIPARPDSFETELVVGSDLALTLPVVGETPPVTAPVNWQADASRLSGSIFRIQGSTTPPATLVFPASLLPVAPGDTVMVNFSRSDFRELGAILPFQARLFEFLAVHWRVAVVAAP